MPTAHNYSRSFIPIQHPISTPFINSLSYFSVNYNHPPDIAVTPNSSTILNWFKKKFLSNNVLGIHSVIVYWLHLLWTTENYNILPYKKSHAMHPPLINGFSTPHIGEFDHSNHSKYTLNIFWDSKKIIQKFEPGVQKKSVYLE